MESLIGERPNRRKNKNEPIRFQYSKNWKESMKISKKVSVFSVLFLILAKYKNGRKRKIFKLSLTAGELEKNVFSQSFVIKEAKYCFT